MENLQREQRAECRGRQPGKNRDRMNEALVQNSQHDVNHQDSHQQQQAESGERSLKRFRGSLKLCGHRGRQFFARQALH